jgi:hypothetical protein
LSVGSTIAGSAIIRRLVLESRDQTAEGVAVAIVEPAPPSILPSRGRTRPR